MVLAGRYFSSLFPDQVASARSSWCGRHSAWWPRWQSAPPLPFQSSSKIPFPKATGFVQLSIHPAWIKNDYFLLLAQKHFSFCSFPGSGACKRQGKTKRRPIFPHRKRREFLSILLHSTCLRSTLCFRFFGHWAQLAKKNVQGLGRLLEEKQNWPLELLLKNVESIPNISRESVTL